MLRCVRAVYTAVYACMLYNSIDCVSRYAAYLLQSCVCAYTKTKMGNIKGKECQLEHENDATFYKSKHITYVLCTSSVGMYAV